MKGDRLQKLENDKMLAEAVKEEYKKLYQKADKTIEGILGELRQGKFHTAAQKARRYLEDKKG